jgi:hypothetical protein
MSNLFRNARSAEMRARRLVIRAQAGIQVGAKAWLDARFRGHDRLMLKKREMKWPLTH